MLKDADFYDRYALCLSRPCKVWTGMNKLHPKPSTSSENLTNHKDQRQKTSVDFGLQLRAYDLPCSHQFSLRLAARSSQLSIHNPSLLHTAR